ncbi:MAG: ABC transporter permease [Thermoanaerobaculia bacterium]|nr:MAG: ABC transporter permease [Thermoanaerobaculia bacterium]
MAAERRGMLVTMVVRSLLNNARISAWALLTLATCAALVTLFVTTSVEAGRRMSAELRAVGANAVAYAATTKEADWSALATVAGAHGSTVVQLAVRVGMVAGAPLAVVAAEPSALQQLTPYWAVTGRRAAAATECMVGRRAASKFALEPGRSVAIDWPGRAPTTPLLVTGVIETGDEDDDRIFIAGPLETVDFRYALLSVPGGDEGMGRLAQALAAAGSNTELAPLRQILSGEKQVLEKVTLLCLVSLWTVLVLTALGVSASMLARVVERRKELALLQALGAQRRSVVGFLLAESSALGLVAALLGFGAGTGLAALVSHQVFRSTVVPHGTAGLAAVATTTLVTLLAGGIAGARAMRSQPAAALRGE